MKPLVLLLCVMFCHVRGQFYRGEDAEQGAFPYAVRLVTGWSCGGAILNTNWVITDAHCVHRENSQGREETLTNVMIVVGDIYRQDQLDSDEIHEYQSDESDEDDREDRPSEHRNYYTSKDVILHIGYLNNQEPYRQFFDVALLYFRGTDGKGIDLEFDDTEAAPYRNPSIMPKVGDPCIAMGWGCTEIDDDGNCIAGSLADRLKFKELKVQALSTMVNYRRKINNEKEFNYFSRLIYVSHGDDGERAVNGDSGSPLVCGGILCGVFKGNSADDGTETGNAMVYNSIHVHLPWIEEKMKEKERQEEQPRQPPQHRRQSPQHRQQSPQQRRQSPRMPKRKMGNDHPHQQHKKQKKESEKQEQANYAAIVTGLSGLAGILFAYRRG